ncbi:MAG: CPBP family intramembrane metalloprotease [Deltaproteobacteria bacterium]|nr:MAG: CPBP family intramembrane metalloprotease [Deltaproteobacteria bacterium]
MSRLAAAWHWAFGDLPEVESPLRDRLLLHTLGTVTCLALLSGMKVRVGGDLIVRGAWRSGMYGAVPLACLALWWAWRERAWPALGLAAVSAVLGALPWAVAVVEGQAGLDALGHAATVAVVAGYGFAYGSLVLGGMALDRFGLGLGDWRWWLPRTGLGLLLLGVGGAALVAAAPDMLAFYPPFRSARGDLAGFLSHVVGLTLDIYGWELMFRGLLLWLFALRGDVRGAIEAQAIVFFLGHLDKPITECLVSLPGGVLAGMFAWRARSFLPLWLLHTAQLIAVNAAGYVARLG